MCILKTYVCPDRTCISRMLCERSTHWAMAASLFPTSSEPTGFLSVILFSRDFYPLHFFHGISIRYTSFMKESVMCRNPVGFDDEWGVTDRNPVGSDDVSLEPLYQFQLNIAQSQGPG